MTKFAIGYQEPVSGEDFSSIVGDYREHVGELYFAWPGHASGRPSLGKGDGGREEEAQENLEYNLRCIRQMGVRLDLLCNASCYGGRSVSKSLEAELCSVVERIVSVAGGLEVVTTSSLAVAWIFKNHFPEIEVRASVNMKVASAESMSYVSELFDSFYIQRDTQRKLRHLRETRDWCVANSKKLCLLANSGCLYGCPGQLFHDNLVAHDAEVSDMSNLEGFVPHVCWELFKKPERRAAILKGSWIRPEDLHHYAPYADVIKLATRVHSNPRMVIDAYVKRSYHGNLLDLFEPTLSMAFAPQILRNEKFPGDWFDKTSACQRNCHECGYCENIFAKVKGSL